MKQAYFVRHAKSSWDNPALADEDRPLNARGKRDAPYMASMMLLKEQPADLLVSSPAVRAVRTARAFRKAFGLKKKALISDNRLYLASPQMMIDVLRELPDYVETPYIFGHNPGMTDLANYFSDDILENVPTCGVFRISCDIDEWYEFNNANSRRTAFYYPKMFQH